MPKLHGYYAAHFDDLLKHDVDLRRNFSNSVWACTTVNFGPQTTCLQHTDFNNVPFGVCSITGAGDYDSKVGGHLALWECRLVIEFPPGSTILIPSSIITHSNVPISKGSTRYSITHYTAGGLFRWVDHGFQSEGLYSKTLSKEDAKKEAEERVQMGMGLFSTREELC
jgi:hypothetical protein